MGAQVSDQINLFDLPRARNSDVHTSHTAAAQAVEVANKFRAACLRVIVAYGPLTGHEVAARLGVGYDKVHKRLPELRDAGLLGWKRVGGDDVKPVYLTRMGPNRRPCVVWHLMTALES
jgi:crotonobetainyl-CoA:carnitine CoA-transferase CaiB-like acyl-CoA transferase